MSRLRIEHGRVRYGRGPVVLDDVTVAVPDRAITAIIGPNGCGKSTLLRTLGRLLRPERGTVWLDDRPIDAFRPNEVARRIAVLPQQPLVPPGLSVRELVRRGRTPYQRWWRQTSPDDEAAVAQALRRLQLDALADHPVDELSGGQRQRAWIAMTLAQGAPILLLDEPTTFLDLAHRAEVLEHLAALHRDDDRTVVMVAHDIGEACRHAHHVIVMRDGAVVAAGAPAETINPDIVEATFGLRCTVIADPVTGTPLVVPGRVDDPPLSSIPHDQKDQR